MSYLRERFMNITIRNKLMLSYVLIALTPFLLFAVMGISLFKTQAEKLISDHTNQMMNQVRNSIDVYINTMEKNSNYIISQIEDINFNQMKSEDDIFWKAESVKISEMLYNLANSSPEIAGILLATENDMYVSTGMTRISSDSFKEEEWYLGAVEKPNEILLISDTAGRNIVTNEGYSIDNVFSVAKAIVYPYTGEVMGVILIDVKHDIISESIKNITIGENGFVFIIDKDQKIVYTPVNKITYRVNPDWLKSETPDFFNARILGEQYQIRFEESEYTGWKVIGVFSLDEVMGSINSMLYILFAFLVVMLVFVIIISLKISQTITNPIVKLKGIMKNAEQGDLTVRFDASYHDEVNELGRTFNQMIEQIGALVEMVYIEQKNKRTAQLKALQEQIKPHFLYNTLDTISWMAREHEAMDVVHLVDALTNMFRIGLSKGRDYVSIEEEITYVSNYLYIQKTRYDSKMNYEIINHVQGEGYQVPKLILQPLVENAIYHGIKTKRGKGSLLIVIEEQDGFLTMSVKDNGSGMDSEKVMELNRLLNERTKLKENQSFGLFYIKERLHLRYGDAFFVFVESEKERGTKVTIRIPISQASEGGNHDE